MKTKLQKKLAVIAPSIAIETIWTHDEDSRFDANGMTKEGGCFYGEDPYDWQAWNSKVKATVIINGDMIDGSGYLGGTWEKYGDDPAENNPEIDGYEKQMTQEALEELLGIIGNVTHPGLSDQIRKAIQTTKDHE